jgi:transcriptional regulator with XRE-family HTH domain
MTEQLGAMLARLRTRKGYSQLRVAEALCAASGTVTRHEISRWERQERIPSASWLRWLAVVLDVPVEQLEAAAALTRKLARPSAPAAGQNQASTEQPPRPIQHAAPAVNAPRAPNTNGPDPLSHVTIQYEHRATSVRLSATYDDPRRALSAIGAFPEVVGVDAASPSDVPSSRPSPPAPAPTTSKPAGLPMGIRYTSGPGVQSPRRQTSGYAPR